MPDKSLDQTALEVAGAWYESHRNAKGNVNTNVMTSGMAIGELLRDHFPLTADTIKSEKNSQVKGLSGKLVKTVLSRFGEERKFTSEGGRTSRGTLVIATELAEHITEAIAPFDPTQEQRERLADELQRFFVRRVQLDYFDKKRIAVDIDCKKPVAAIVADILQTAKNRADQPTGIVAQHLVGAKLELRFPQLKVGRDKANAADQQTDRQGDFQLGNTAFHVTVAPAAKLADGVKENLRQGFRSVVLVPESSVQFASGLFNSEGIGDRVSVQSIETFVGTNVEEMALFESARVESGVARLIKRYNVRIRECEVDQSLQIEEPVWMADTTTEYCIMQ